MTERPVHPALDFTEAELAAERAAEEEAELADNWDCFDADAYMTRVEAALEHACPGPECHPYPAFGDDPARWGLLPGPPMTEAELAAAAELDAWGPRGPSASYAEWLAESLEPEPEAGP